ncbi:MAG: hypothetical protein MUC43_01365 [Pirellula sp.]|nr:hypothetical protein [Pirellula sp.]
MDNSRRSKKRSKFFWPEIGLLILGVLGFKPELLYSVLGVSSQSNQTTSRPANQLQPGGQHPLASNPLVVWGAQAIQSAASHASGVPSQQTFQPNYGAPQFPQYQQPTYYAEHGSLPYQQAYQSQAPAYQYGQWAANNNQQPSQPVANYSGTGFASRVPPVDYQNTPAAYPPQPRANVPFPSTNGTSGTNQPYNSGLGNSYPSYNQPAAVGLAQGAGYPTMANQNLANSQNQYYWGSFDPRTNNNQQLGTQGTWIPNIPAPNMGTSRSGRY